MAKTALVTGASGGIGYELSKILAAEGYDLVLVARSEIKLNDIAAEIQERYGVTATVMAKDLCDPAAPDDIFATLQEQSITLDVLVNNAGFGVYGLFVETDLAEEMDMIRLNVVALTHLTKLFLPGMVERGSGRILNVASTAAFQPGPLMAAYCATKAYSLNLSEAVYHELRGKDVTLTTLCPGVTFTGFQARAEVGDMPLIRLGGMSAESVARIGYRAMMRGKAVKIPGLMNQLMALTSRFTPRPLVRMISYRLMLR